MTRNQTLVLNQGAEKCRFAGVREVRLLDTKPHIPKPILRIIHNSHDLTRSIHIFIQSDTVIAIISRPGIIKSQVETKFVESDILPGARFVWEEKAAAFIAADER